MKRNKNRFYKWECKDCGATIEGLIDTLDKKRKELIWEPICWICDKDMVRVDLNAEKKEASKL